MKRLIAAVCLVVFAAASAFALQTGGVFPGDKYSTTGTQMGQLRFTTMLAPVTQDRITITKGFVNKDMTGYSQFKFWFTKASDDTATTTICKIRYGGFTTGTETAVATSGETLAVSLVPVVGFTCASSAGVHINRLLQ